MSFPTIAVQTCVWVCVCKWVCKWQSERGSELALLHDFPCFNLRWGVAVFFCENVQKQQERDSCLMSAESLTLLTLYLFSHTHTHTGKNKNTKINIKQTKVKCTKYNYSRSSSLKTQNAYFDDVKQRGIMGFVYFIVKQPLLQMKISVTDTDRNVHRWDTVFKFDLLCVSPLPSSLSDWCYC